MKAKYIIILLLTGIVFPCLSVAQTNSYRSYFGNEFTKWYIYHEALDLGFISELYYVDNQDTLLSNGIHYKKVNCFHSLDLSPSNAVYYFGIREDSTTGSLFIGLDGNTDELISTMKLNIGDKFYFPATFLTYNNPNCRNCFINIRSDENGNYATVDSIFYEDNRKHIRFDAIYQAFSSFFIPLTFIEGIGPNVSFAPILGDIQFNYWGIVCANCYETENGLWKSKIKIPSQQSEISFEDIDCFFTTVGIPQTQSDIPLKLIQRKGEIELQPDAGGFGSGTVYIYSIDGKLMYSKPIQENVNIIISTSSFSSGTYIIQLTDEKTKRSWNRKVVIN